LANGFDGLLFDLDGTLVDNDDQYMEGVLSCVGERLGRGLTVEQARDLWYSRGAPTREEVIRGWGLDPDEFWKVFNELDTEENRLAHTYLHGDVVVLREIRLPKAIVTHTPQELTRKILERVGISDMFSAVVSCDECSGWKPSPLPVIYALAELGLQPTRALFIGDTASDVAAAQDAGVASAILDRNGWQRDLSADYYLGSLRELPALLG